MRPPIFDSPTTRGLYDPTTGVYWGSDGFATPMDRPVTSVDELDADFWVQGIHTFDNYISRWLPLVDDARYQATVDRVAELQPTCTVPKATSFGATVMQEVPMFASSATRARGAVSEDT